MCVCVIDGAKRGVMRLQFLDWSKPNDEKMSIVSGDHNLPLALATWLQPSSAQVQPEPKAITTNIIIININIITFGMLTQVSCLISSHFCSPEIWIQLQRTFVKKKAKKYLWKEASWKWYERHSKHYLTIYHCNTKKNHPHGIRIQNDSAQADTASPKDSKSKNNSPRGSESWNFSHRESESGYRSPKDPFLWKWK